MRSSKTKKIETAAQDRPLQIQWANDEATVEQLMQAMTAFMAASAEYEAAAPAQRAA